MPKKATIRIAKLNPTSDCPDFIDTSAVLDNLTNTKSNYLACDLPFMSPIKKTKNEQLKNRLLGLTYFPQAQDV